MWDKKNTFKNKDTVSSIDLLGISADKVCDFGRIAR